jgi:opacity protein-like surface antigen
MRASLTISTFLAASAFVSNALAQVSSAANEETTLRETKVREEPPSNPEIGASLGIVDAGGRYGPGAAIVLEAAQRWTVGPGSIVLGGRFSYERYALGASQTVPCRGPSFGCGSGDLTYLSSLSANVFGIGAPLSYRHRVSAIFEPYALVMPQVLFVGTTERAHGRVGTFGELLEERRETFSSTRFGFTAALGIDLQVGPHDAIAAELGYRWVGVETLPQGDDSLRGLVASIGYRHGF